VTAGLDLVPVNVRGFKVRGYANEIVRDWYGGRTEHILERYGADAPRVHYHTGLLDELSDTQDVNELKRILRQAQIRLLDVAAKEWQINRLRGGNILDSGCGLGGGSIYWAEKYSCAVTGVSLVQEHLNLVDRYASETGLSNRIDTILCDVHEIHLEPSLKNKYDAVIAIDSSCYMDLPRWFGALRQVLVPDGKIYIADGFVGPGASQALVAKVDDYFKTRMVRLTEYATIAHSFKAWDLSDRAARFFDTTYALIFIQAVAANNLHEKERSLSMHKLLRHAFEARLLYYLLLEADPWK
jgi:tocopherol O-methyltransferase